MSVALIAWLTIEMILRIAALFVVPRNRKPTAGLAWMLVIFLMPIPGWIIFSVIGSYKLPPQRRDMQRTLDAYIEGTLHEIRHKKQIKVVDEVIPAKYQQASILAQSLTHFPAFLGNKVEPIADYDKTISNIIKDIDQASHYIYIEYYILALDETTERLFESLKRAISRGVKVRVMYDAYGSRKYKRFGEMKRLLDDLGVEHHPMLPLTLPGRGYMRPDLRNHRKLVVVDGAIGYTGSLNMIARSYHRSDSIVYDELTVRLSGPIVQQLRAVFLTDWFSETGKMLKDTGTALEELVDRNYGATSMQMIPSGPGYDDENNLKVFNAIFYDARESITIVNPYFVPDESLIVALISAARRGVRVRLINSEAIDQRFVAHAQRSYYEEMFRAGVEVYLYEAPTLLHSKYILIDDDLSLVGSSNMDIRSFELNHELTVMVYGVKDNAKLHRITEEYLEKSKQVNAKRWLSRPPRLQLLDNIARLTSSLQ